MDEVTQTEAQSEVERRAAELPLERLLAEFRAAYEAARAASEDVVLQQELTAVAEGNARAAAVEWDIARRAYLMKSLDGV